MSPATTINPPPMHQVEAASTRRAWIGAVVRQHAEEISMRWMRRLVSHGSSALSFEQRRREDEALAAHADALLIAGERGWKPEDGLCGDGTPGDQFTHALAAALAADPQRFHARLACTADQPAMLVVAFSALSWLAPASAAPYVAWGLSHTHTNLLAAALAAAAALRIDLRWQLPAFFSHPSPEVQAAAFAYAADMGHVALLPQLCSHVANPSGRLALAAALAAFRLGDRAVSVTCLEAAILGTGAGSGPALALLAAGLPLPDSRLLLRQAATRGVAESVLIAAIEASADARYLPWLAARQQHAEHGALAQEALCTITGLVVGDVPATPTRGSAALVEGPWQASDDQRWLAGQPLSTESLFDTLLHGRLRHRAFAAQHLALLAPGLPRLHSEAPAPAQLGWIYKAEITLYGATA